MPPEDRPSLPIGYWLKLADERLTAHIDAAQRAHGLSRLDWQALHVVHRTEVATLDGIASALAPFATPRTVADRMEALAGRGLVDRLETGAYTLSSAGADLYDRARETQQEVRDRAASGISREEYDAAVRVLRRLAGNLSEDDTA